MSSGADHEEPASVDWDDIQYAIQNKRNLGIKESSNGASARYYELPVGSSELQDLISAKNMNAQIGEIFRECYRYGKASHCDELRGVNKIIFYALAEKKRLERLHVGDSK